MNKRTSRLPYSMPFYRSAGQKRGSALRSQGRQVGTKPQGAPARLSKAFRTRSGCPLKAFNRTLPLSCWKGQALLSYGVERYWSRYAMFWQLRYARYHAARSSSLAFRHHLRLTPDKHPSHDLGVGHVPPRIVGRTGAYIDYPRLGVSPRESASCLQRLSTASVSPCRARSPRPIECRFGYAVHRSCNHVRIGCRPSSHSVQPLVSSPPSTGTSAQPFHPCVFFPSNRWNSGTRS